MRLFLLLFVLTGCSIRPATRVQTGFSLTDTSIGIVRQNISIVAKSEYLDVGVGRSIIAPVSEDGLAYGVEAFVRPKYNCGIITPFIIGGLGYVDLTEQWGRQSGTDGFTIQGGLGALVPLGSNFEFSCDLSWFHESNGAGLNIGTYPNPGFDTALFSIGIEYNF